MTDQRTTQPIPRIAQGAGDARQWASAPPIEAWWARLALTIALAALVTLPGRPFAATPAPEVPTQSLSISPYRGYLNADHPVSRGLAKLGDLIAANSDLRLTVVAPAPGSRPAQQISAVRARQPHSSTPQLMLQASTGLVELVDEFGLLDLPFAIRDHHQADALLAGPFGNRLLATLPEQGLVGLAYWENGFRHMTSNKAPIDSAEDFKGLKMRVIPSPLFREPFDAIGARTTTMPFADLYPALASGAVDAQDNYYSQILAGKLHQVQRYLSETYHSYSALVVVINKAAWEQLSPAQQEALRQAAVAAGDYQRTLNRQNTREARAKIESLGMQVNRVPAPEIDRLQRLATPAVENLVQGYDTQMVELFWRELGQQD